MAVVGNYEISCALWWLHIFVVCDFPSYVTTLQISEKRECSMMIDILTQQAMESTTSINRCCYITVKWANASRLPKNNDFWKIVQAKIFKLFFAFLQKNGLLCYIIPVVLLVFFSVAFYKSHVVTERCADLKCYFSTQYFGTLTLTFSKHIAAVIGLIASLGVTKILLIALQKGQYFYPSFPVVSCIS